MFKASRSERISDVCSIGKIEAVLGRKEKIMCKVYSVSNQKGGVSKTATCVNLGIGLARAGKKVCLIEAYAQSSLTESLGIDPCVSTFKGYMGVRLSKISEDNV